MQCRHCKKVFNVPDAKYCPYCAGLLGNFYFTKEQDLFLRGHNNMHRQDLADLFNATFHEDKTALAISHRCRRIGLEMPKEARYDAESRSHMKYEIGAEREYRGVTWVKVANNNDHHPKSWYASSNWKRKHYLVWERANGPVPEGKVLVFLDGDSKNCSLDNLYCTDKSNALFTSNPMVFRSESPTTRKAELQWGELYFAVKEAGS